MRCYLVALVPVLVHEAVVCVALENYFLAPTGALGMLLSVCPSIWFSSTYSRALFFHFFDSFQLLLTLSDSLWPLWLSLTSLTILTLSDSLWLLLTISGSLQLPRASWHSRALELSYFISLTPSDSLWLSMNLSESLWLLLTLSESLWLLLTPSGSL